MRRLFAIALTLATCFALAPNSLTQACGRHRHHQRNCCCEPSCEHRADGGIGAGYNVYCCNPVPMDGYQLDMIGSTDVLQGAGYVCQRNNCNDAGACKAYLASEGDLSGNPCTRDEHKVPPFKPGDLQGGFDVYCCKDGKLHFIGYVQQLINAPWVCWHMHCHLLHCRVAPYPSDLEGKDCLIKGVQPVAPAPSH